MDIPYCVHLNTLSDSRWEELPDGYHITYQPSDGGHDVYLAWNDHIELSCTHFKCMNENVVT